ncbi:MAG: hypothetical protein C0407_09335, partial [Desulfobacca sp.]|nr:hypothetical protein [Desulfobacca sp.]
GWLYFHVWWCHAPKGGAWQFNTKIGLSAFRVLFSCPASEGKPYGELGKAERIVVPRPRRRGMAA